MLASSGAISPFGLGRLHGANGAALTIFRRRVLGLSLRVVVLLFEAFLLRIGGDGALIDEVLSFKLGVETVRCLALVFSLHVFVLRASAARVFLLPTSGLCVLTLPTRKAAGLLFEERFHHVVHARVFRTMGTLLVVNGLSFFGAIANEECHVHLELLLPKAQGP